MNKNLNEKINEVMESLDWLASHTLTLKTIIEDSINAVSMKKELKEKCDILEDENKKLKKEIENYKDSKNFIKMFLNMEYGKRLKESVGYYTCDPEKMEVTRLIDGRIEHYKLSHIDIDYENKKPYEVFHYYPLEMEVVRVTPRVKQYFKMYKREEN